MQLSQSINRQLNRFTDENSQQRLQDILKRLENIILERESKEQQEKHLQIQKQQKSATKAWLEKLENQNTRLEKFTEPDQKIEAASQLYKEIAQWRNQHEERLTAKQKQTLERIVNRCIEIQNQDRESKILVLFRELPLAQRESLYNRLAKYLSGATEEF